MAQQTRTKREQKGSKAQRARKNFNQGSKQSRKVKYEQPRKDSKTKRVNFDNAREDKVAKQIMADAQSGKFNDINDFLKNPTLVQAAGSIPVFPIIGNKVADLDPVPGAMIIKWAPTFGALGSGKARIYDVDGTMTPFTPAPFAINQAKDTTYSFLVHANSRNYSYNSSDLFLLIMAGSQVFAAIEAMKRAYGLIRRYVETSSYMPDSILRGMGFEPDDMRDNFSHMWFDINMLISQTRQIWVPNSFPLISRWVDMNSEIYKDAEGQYSQLYVFVQGIYYMYDEVSIKNGGCLKRAGYSYVNTDGTVSIQTMTPGQMSSNGFLTYTWAQWVSMVQNMLSALINSEDRGIIYGDMLNAYTAERIIAIPEIPVDYMIDPVYTPEISMQIENLTTTSDSMVPNYWGQIENRIVPIWQDSLIPSKTPGSSAGCWKNWSLNFHTTTDPTPEMILLATRFMCLGMRQAIIATAKGDGSEVQSAATYIPQTHGSELITGVTMIIRPIGKNSADNVQGRDYADIRQYSTTSSATVYTATSPNQWRHLMSFDWHPFTTQIISNTLSYPEVDTGDANDGKDCSYTIERTYGDQDRYCEISWQELQRINEVAFLSLYDVPSVLS